MSVTLYNLTDKEKWIAQTIWDLKTQEQYLELLKSLPESQRFEVNSIVKMINWGTDDVVDLQQAQEVLDRFRKL
jgi:hypothetical protein